MKELINHCIRDPETTVRICNFTDSYKKIPEFQSLKKEICDLSDVSESTGYCSDQAAERIRERLLSIPPEGLHYLDDGNHHYLSRLMIEKIRQPFDLVVFDHHTDMQPSALLPFLSCGNWILKSLQEVECLRDVWLIGPPENAFADTYGFEDRVHIISQEAAEAAVPELPQSGRRDPAAAARPVYISVDLDILSPDEFTSIWDQGSMTKQKLVEWIESIHSTREVLGEDLCG